MLQSMGSKESDTTERLNNNYLLCSTWNSTQCYMAAWMGGEFGKEWTRTYVWLSPLTVHLKLSPQCESAISQDKIKSVLFCLKRAVAKSCPKLPAEPANQKAFQSSKEYLFIRCPPRARHCSKRHKYQGRRSSSSPHGVLDQYEAWRGAVWRIYR